MSARPPLLLLPGLMCDARIFAPQVAALSAGRTVMVPDLTRHDTMEGLAGAVLAEAPPRFWLAGLSMGGIVAMRMLDLAPDRIAGIALLDTNEAAEPSEVRSRRSTQIERALNGELGAIMRDEMKPRYLADGPRRGELLDLCMEMAVGLGADVFARQSAAIRDRPDSGTTLSRVTCPTLVLCGAEDALCPPRLHERMHGLVPRSRLVVVEGAGHLPTLEQPDATNRALKEWMTDD